MQLQQLREIFHGDAAILSTVWGDAPSEAKVSPAKLIQNIVRAKNQALTERVKAALLAAQKANIQSKDVGPLLTKLEGETGFFDMPRSQETKTFLSRLAVPFSKFQEQLTLLTRDNFAECQRVVQQIDTTIALREKPTFDANTLERYVPGITVNATEVKTRQGKTPAQHLVFTACPGDATAAGDLLSAARVLGAQVWVSLNQKKDGPALANPEEEATRQKYAAFWEKGTLETIPLRDGWKIESSNPHMVHAQDNMRIWETQIVFTKEGEPNRTLSHLFVEGWPDYSESPSEEVIMRLLDRVEELSPQTQLPVIINCHAGHGRTGEVGIGLMQRRKIRAALEKGKNTVNFMKALYDCRRVRANFGGKPIQIMQAASFTQRYLIQAKLTTTS